MEIRFIYEKETWIETNFDGKDRELTAPKGEGHIFTMGLVKGKMEITGFSLCGKSRIEIGKNTLLKHSRVVTLPVCFECSETWKKHPESQWSKFVGVGAK